MDDRWIFGVDLGTTFSTVSVITDNGQVDTLVPSVAGSKALPSALYFPHKEVVVAGREAFSISSNNSNGTLIQDSKKYIGLPCSSPPPPWYVEDIPVCPVTAGAILLKALKQMAKNRWPNNPMEKVVITHPQHWSEVQKSATRQAGEWAGLEVVSTLSEPQAAAVACGLESSEEDSRILVFDLGGGTFDTTIFEVNAKSLQMITGDGDANLGGRNWDSAIRSYLLQEWKNRTGYDYEDTTSRNYSNQLNEEIKEAKIKLQSEYTSQFNVRLSGGDLDENKLIEEPSHLQVNLTKDILNDITSSLLDRVKDVVIRTLLNKELSPEDIDWVVLAGGSSKLLAVRELLFDMFGEEKCKYDNDPLNLISVGAAWIANNFRETELKFSDHDAQSVNADDTPKNKSKETGIRTREAIFAKNCGDPVVTKTVGVKAMDDNENYVIEHMIFKDTRREQACCERDFFAVSEGQETVEVNIFEGESKDPFSCDQIGSIQLKVPALKKDAPIKVKFQFHDSGILSVKVKDPNSGKESEVSIERTALVENTANYDQEKLKNLARSIKIVFQ